MKLKITSSAIFATLLTPLLTFAQNVPTNNPTGGFGSFFLNIITFIKTVLTSAFPIVTAILVLAFGWTVFKFLTDQAPEDKAKDKSRLISALFALFLWFAAFGIITLVANSIGAGVGGQAGQQQIFHVDFTQ